MEKLQKLKSWEEFEPALAELARATPKPDSLLYRGHTDASWLLETTLERHVGNNYAMGDYYKAIRIIKPQIEAFTAQTLEDFDLQKIYGLCANYDSLSVELSFGRLPAYSYLAYLRHHGFPSPLLDWSSSPYVAAFFAFRKPSREKYHAIYAYSEFGMGGKSRGSKNSAIYGFGPVLSTHRRHFLQQSQYTICTIFSGPDQLEWRFSSHEDVFNRNERGQDFLTKFLIPATERSKVLKSLQKYNLTAFSLFGSEESLMEALAIQEFDLN